LEARETAAQEAFDAVVETKTARDEQKKLQQAKDAKEREYNEQKIKVEAAKKVADGLKAQLATAEAAFAAWKAADAAHLEGHADFEAMEGAVNELKDEITRNDAASADVKAAFDAVTAQKKAAADAERAKQL
jgi:hypothetical protein